MNENVPAVAVSISAASRTVTLYCADPPVGRLEFGAFVGGVAFGAGIEITSAASVNWKQLVPHENTVGEISVVTPFSTRLITSDSPEASAPESVTWIVGVGSFVVLPAAMLLFGGTAPVSVEFGATLLNAANEKVCAGAMLSTVKA